jgi:prevent-host-death family protein
MRPFRLWRILAELILEAGGLGMDEIRVTDARRRFGAFLRKVDEAPLSITKGGKEIAVATSAAEYREMLARKAEREAGR